ncbi:hypothetical protein R70331_25650 [Paenibacillus sp. FSL R7-0331]|nr:hypothetical protein R70331_25650 [Paenibacillus sp. FSL R7-0331]
MAIVTTVLHCEVDPRNPVLEALAVIDALLQTNGPHNADAILKGVQEGIESRLNFRAAAIQKKGAEKHAEPVHGSTGPGADQ